MKGKKNDNTWQMIGITSAMGFEIFAFIIIGALLGKYAGDSSGSRIWFPLGAVAGFLFGLFSCYMTLRSLINRK